jgi:hypothetical protein
MDDAELVNLLQICTNAGRWGSGRRSGTLNYLTDQKRRYAAVLERWEFLVACGPVHISGGTGAPVNPFCVF